MSIILIFGIVQMTLTSCQGDKKQNLTGNEETVSEAVDPKEIIEEQESNENAETEKESDMKEEVEVEETTTESVSEIPQEQLDKAEEIIASVSEADAFAVDASKLFRMQCAICHGFKGNMKVNGAKDLTQSNISLAESVAQIYHGKGLMTPYKGKLKNEEIVALAKYIEDFRK